MNQNCAFFHEPTIDLCAAMVGTHHTQLTSVSESDATNEKAQDIMESKRFDVLPITSLGEITEYYATLSWNNFTSVTRSKVSNADLLSFNTPIKKAIERFAADTRNFYFLEKDSRIEGLIIISDLNSRLVKLYLYNLLSDLEVHLGRIIKQHCEEDEIVGFLKDQQSQQYRTDKERGVDASSIEYLYLPEFLRIFGQKGLWNKLEYVSKSKFDDAFNPLVKLRDKVAHPNRSLISSVEDCKKLCERISTIERALSILNQPQSGKRIVAD